MLLFGVRTTLKFTVHNSNTHVIKSNPKKMSVHKYLLKKTKELLYTDIFQLKKKLVVMSFILRYFLMGVEYSIILPTALLYMKTFGAGPFMTGLTIAAYPIAAIISLPLFGYFYDRTKRLKELLLLLNFFEALGNLIYALPFSIWLPLLGRFIAGIGDGFLALTVGELTYLYDDSQRLGILSLLELGRVLGLIIGPSFNFLIEGKRFQVESWTLDDNTLPGVVMAIMWSILEFLTFFCVFNLAKELIELNRPPGEGKKSLHDKEQLQTEEQALLSPKEELEESDHLEDEEEAGMSLSGPGKHSTKISPGSLHSSDESLFHPTLEKHRSETPRRRVDDDLRTQCSSSSSSTSSRTSLVDNEEEVKDVGKGIFHEKQIQFNEYWESMKEILCVEFFLVTSVDFTLWFCQTNFEILAPYITEFDYMWSPQLTGMVYVVGGFLIVFVFLGMYLVASKCTLKDTHLILVSLICTQFSLGLLMFESTFKVLHQRVIIFVIIAVLVFISIPLNLVCSKTLLSKLFHPEKMGVVQGLSSGIARITMISGPLLSGYIHKDRMVYGGVTSVFVFMNIIGFFIGLKRIHKREKWLRRELRLVEKHGKR